MSPLRILAIILGSSLVFPASCTCGLFLGVQGIAEYDARNITKGDKPHPVFSVLAREHNSANSNFTVISLAEAQKEPIQYDFQLPNTKGTVDGSAYYQVTSHENGNQTIELRSQSRETSVFSKYIANKQGVVPLYSKLMYHGYIFSAFPIAVLFAIIVTVIAKRIRRRIIK